MIGSLVGEYGERIWKDCSDALVTGQFIIQEDICLQMGLCQSVGIPDLQEKGNTQILPSDFTHRSDQWLLISMILISRSHFFLQR